MKTPLIAVTLALLALSQACGIFTGQLRADDIVANSVVTVADDFVVDVYLNGKLVPDEKRHLTGEVFGATREQIDITVHRGDWLVFHVVNDRMRWNGSYYFAAAGLLGKDEFGFVSSSKSGDWYACGQPADADRFIEEESYTRNQSAEKIANPWGNGPGLMKQSAGDTWSGDPIWGRSKDRDVWLKLIVNYTKND